jgi:transposase
VALLESSGRPQMQVAAELGIQPSMLRNWRAVLNGEAPRSRPVLPTATGPVSPVASPADQAAEIARLRRELDRARMERDILKKAIGIFSETPR